MNGQNPSASVPSVRIIRPWFFSLFFVLFSTFRALPRERDEERVDIILAATCGKYTLVRSLHVSKRITEKISGDSSSQRDEKYLLPRNAHLVWKAWGNQHYNFYTSVRSVRFPQSFFLLLCFGLCFCNRRRPPSRITKSVEIHMLIFFPASIFFFFEEETKFKKKERERERESFSSSNRWNQREIFTIQRGSSFLSLSLSVLLRIGFSRKN